MTATRPPSLLPSLASIWGLLWRAVLFIPLACAVTLLLLVGFGAVPFALLIGWIYASAGLWWQAGAFLGGVVVLGFATLRMWRRIAGEPSDYPGDTNV